MIARAFPNRAYEEDYLRNATRRLTTVILSATAAIATLAGPAQAAANPYTAAGACANEFGGSWSSASDGHRTISSGSTKVGDVYLMYNGATGYNCVVTLKSVSVGTASGVGAWLLVQGSDWRADEASYKYYAAIQRPAADKCVQYTGEVLYGTSWASNGRYTWGNCG